MLFHYCIAAFRNLRKRNFFSAINIFGLAMGLSVCLVIWNYAGFETSYEKFNSKRDRIYRVLSTLYTKDAKITAVGHDLAPALKEGIPEIEECVRLTSKEAIVSRVQGSDGKSFRESNIRFTDHNFFDVFGYYLIKGNAASALRKPSSVVITESIAKKYFAPSEDPIGQILHFSDNGDFEITAIAKDPPQNSHLTFTFILPIQKILDSEFYRNNPRYDNFITYIVLRDHGDITQVARKLFSFTKAYVANGKDENRDAVIRLQPIQGIHLAGGSSDLNDRESRPSDLNRIYFFMLISFFMLAIAWVNYINLSTAQAMERAKEVGIKKSLGVQKWQLITQFFTEAMMINLIGLAVAVALGYFLLSVLGPMIGKHLYFDFSTGALWVQLVLLFVVGTIASGGYPALVLSRFRTADVLKGTAKNIGVGAFLRKFLVVFQFASSLLLIAATLAIYRQLHFMESQDKGLKTSQMLIVSAPQEIEDKWQQRLITFKKELQKFSSVEKVTTSGAIPGGGHSWETHAVRKGASAEEDIPGENINVVFVDPDFVDTYEMNLISGHTWNEDRASDMHSVIINEATLSRFGLGDAEHALNEKLVFEGHDTLTIAGVLKNYHWMSLKAGYAPTLLWPQKISFAQFSIVLNSNIQRSIRDIETLYKSSFPGNPFEYYFLDDYYDAQYKSEKQFVDIFTMFSALAIAISCLGLLGLAFFTTAQRSKEISIRKILGASVAGIVILLTSQFMRLVLIASLVALPIGLYGIDSWLDNFPFRIAMSWELCLIPVLMLIAVALFTISIQTIGAALRDPVKGLKTE